MSSLPSGSLETLHARNGAMLVYVLFAVFASVLGVSLVSCSEPGAAPVLRTSPTTSAMVPARFLVPAGRVAGVYAEPDIRVRLRSRATSMEIRADGRVRLVDAGGGVQDVGTSGGNPLMITRSGNRWRVSNAGALKTFTADERVEIRAEGLRLDGAAHPGRVVLKSRSDVSDRAFDVLEEIGLELYLSGVVAKEMVIGWNVDAFRVQAIAARSYAIHESLRARAKGRSYDVESSTLDQVYGGRSTDPTVVEAVESTRGVVLINDTEVLRAYYSSTCGGRTAGGTDSWPHTGDFAFNGVIPLRSAHRAFACQSSPLFRWELTRDRGHLSRRIRAYGDRQKMSVRKLRTLGSIEPSAVNVVDRPVKYRVKDRSGSSWEISADHLRLACNQNVRGLPKITSKNRVNSGDFSVTIRGERATIKGRGFGHGVGMCQFCAQGFATSGDDWRVMLRRFYPGARLVRAYE